MPYHQKTGQFYNIEKCNKLFENFGEVNVLGNDNNR